MPAERYYSPSILEQGAEVRLEKGEHHHLVHVMRAKVGDQVELVNGKGALAACEVATLSKREAILIVRSVEFQEAETNNITLYQAIPRMNRLDTIIEKCTELGMTEMVLWASEYSERKKLTDDQVERLQHVAISAMKQCGRLYLPKISFAKTLQFENSALYFGDLAPEAPKFYNINIQPSCGFVIGPESGLTENEMAHLRKSGALGVNLHENVLRTDTAAITALVLISSKLMGESPT